LLGCSLALSLQHRFRHLFDKQWDAIAAFDDVVPDARRKQLVANDTVDHGANFSLRQPIEREGGHVRSPNPGRLELRAKSHDQQHAKRRDLVHAPTESFKAGRVGPMRILENHRQRILPSQRSHLGG
jgi:hypothetical protein